MRAPALATTALLACLALVGCEKDAVGPVDPDDTATPSQPSPTPTPTGPTPPVLPEAAKANTAQGAIAFVEHYVELMNYSARTGETDVIRAASQSCGTCDSYIALYERTYRDGGFSGDPGWRSTADLSERSGTVFRVLTTISTQKYRYKKSASSTEQIVGATSYKLVFDVTFASPEPRVTLIDQQVTE